MKIELIKTGDLIPYVNNARTHSDESVTQVAASIKEFGFTNPILIDEDSGIVAGHGRLMAAKKLGMDEVPCIKLSHLSDSMRRNGVKDVLCEDCGSESTVRKDTSPKVCKRCASVRGGKAMKGVTRVPRVKCKTCQKPIRETLGHTYCSVACRKIASHEDRTCKTCSKVFEVYKSAMSDKTNSAGNFCSRPCYEKWMCRTGRVTGRGSQWKKVRTEAIRRQPFCALCGTRHGLQVHHIAPFRLSFDNSQNNLVPLCTKHHKIVESMTHDIEHSGSSADEMTLIIGGMLKQRSLATRYKLMEISGKSATLESAGQTFQEIKNEQ